MTCCPLLEKLETGIFDPILSRFVLLWVCIGTTPLPEGALLQCKEVSGRKLQMVYSVSLHWLGVMQESLFHGQRIKSVF